MDDREQSWILKALREAGNELIGQFYGLGEEELRWRPLDDERSLAEIASHLRDREQLTLRQIEVILETEDEPVLPTADFDSLSLDRDYQKQEVREELRAFVRLRRRTSMTLWGLMTQDWERCGRHPYRGPVSIAQMVRELAQHDLGHLWQVRRLKERVSEREGEGESR
jgi:hypothetical protein